MPDSIISQDDFDFWLRGSGLWRLSLENAMRKRLRRKPSASEISRAFELNYLTIVQKYGRAAVERVNADDRLYPPLDFSTVELWALEYIE